MSITPQERPLDAQLWTAPRGSGVGVRRAPGRARGGLETVVLDLDDTLIASSRARRRAFLSLGFEPALAEATRGRWWGRYARLECSKIDLYRGCWSELGVAPARALDVEEAFSLHHAGIRARRGAHRMLEAFRQAGLTTVILSNSSLPYVRDRLAQLDLDGLIDGIVDVEAGRLKPHPEAFLAALTLAGSPPDRAAMVGDRLELDIEGALAAGFRTAVWLTSRKPHPDPRVITVRSPVEAAQALLRRR